MASNGHLLKRGRSMENPAGDRMARVHKALVSPFPELWKIDVEEGPDLEAQGNIVDHEYGIEADGRKVARTSKQRFRLRDTYGVEMAQDQNPVLLLALTVAIDEMAHS